MIRIASLSLLLLILLSACANEQTYRGVSAGRWRQLTAEQKQLIIDAAFEKDLGKYKK